MEDEGLGGIPVFLQAWMGPRSLSATRGVTQCLQSLWLLCCFPDPMGIPTTGNGLWVWKG